MAPGAGASDWIVGRAFLAFTVLEGAGIPPGRRKSFVANAARRWAPVADPQFHVEWVGDRAMVWAWSTAAVLAPAREGGERPPRRLLPESLHRGEAREDGEQLVAMDEGVEGRVWREGLLVASRWWPQAPDLREWNAFRRGAGLAVAGGVPALEAPGLVPAGWARARARPGVDLARHRALATPVLVGLAMLMLCVPLGAALRLAGERARLERAIAVQEGLVKELLSARESAEGDAQAIDQLASLRPPAGHIRILSTLVRVLPPGWQLLEWRMPDPTSLELTVRLANPDPRTLVRMLEDSPVLDAARVDLGARPDEVVLRATVVPAEALP